MANYTYALNIGTADSNALNYTWAQRWKPTLAFTEVSVNPVLKNPEGNSGYSTTCANFFEIRNAPTDVGATIESDISNNGNATIVNRILPSTNALVLNNYATNKQETQQHKIRCYDPTQTVSGQKVSGSSAPNSGLDLDNIDFFVLINPEVTDENTPSVRPHFAKIVRIVSYDEYGDGFEFEPKYPSSIPEGTNFEVYQGPAVTNTNVIAVSYGLRGDTATNTTLDKYEQWSKISRPTWYFYEDRLINKNQLDYDTKYQLTTCRWFSDWVAWGSSGTGYAGTANVYTGPQTITTSNVTWVNTQFSDDRGNSVWRDVSGVKKLIGNITATATNQITVDQIRNTMPTTSGAAIPIYKGRTIHQTVFRTEREYGNNISDLGRLNHNAILVDNMRDKVDDYDNDNNYTEDPSYWNTTHRNYSRNIIDKNSDHTTYTASDYSYLHSNLTGPKRYLYYKKSNIKNNGVTNIIEAHVNNPHNKMSQLASIKTIDESGIKHLKLKEDSPLTIRTAIHKGVLEEYELPFTVDTETTSGYNFILQQILETFDCRNDSFIKVGDIIRVNNYHYRVSVIGSPLTSLRTQALTVDKQKAISENTWSNVTSLPILVNQKIFVRAWNGGLTGSIPIDTEVAYTSNAFSRLTMNGRTISKKKSSLYNDKLVLLDKQFLGHDIPIDYGDSVNKYVKLQYPTKLFYVPTNNISFLHYISGPYAIDEEVFKGTIEDISSKNESGRMTYTLTGRDELARLLDNTVNKNLQRTEDIIYSTLNPLIDYNTTLIDQDNSDAIVTPNGSYQVDTVSNTTSPYFMSVIDTDNKLQALNKYDLVFDQSNNLIGEVESAVDFDTNKTKITWTHKPINAVLVGGPRTFKYVQLNSNENYLTALKAMGANIKETTYPTDFSALGNNGVNFTEGFKTTFATNGTKTNTNLIYTSSTGKYSSDGSMGYDISNIKALSRNNDSCFMFKLGNETDIGITLNTINTVSSMIPYKIVNMNVKDEEKTTITVAPSFPLVLGSIETNSSDTTIGDTNSNIYLVNNNIPKGGFLHKLSGTHGGLYTSDTIYRYTDLQSFKEGTIRENYVSVYNDNNTSQKITGYCPAFKINSQGTITAITPQGANNVALMGDLTQGLRPERESNFWTGTHIGLAGGRKAPYTGLTTSGENSGLLETSHTQKWTQLENIDYRCKNYEILSMGDLYPESKLRHNNIGLAADANNFSSFGLLLEDEGTPGTKVNHINYTGKTSRITHRDSDYERIGINGASITANNTQRFGVMRLVEATFDWHFNPIDYESTPSSKQIPRFDDEFMYPRFRLIHDDKTISSATTTSWTLNANVTLAVGDIIYDKNGRGILRVTQTISNSNALASTGGGTNVVESLDTNEIYADDITIMRPELFQTYADEGYGLNRLGNNVNQHLKMLTCYLVIPKIKRDYLNHSLLKGTSSELANPHNLWFPLISEAKTGGISNALSDGNYYSAFNERADWSADNHIAYHPSRVVNALTRRTFGTANDTIQYKIGGLSHPYRGTHMLFKDFHKSTKQNSDNIEFDLPTSSYMGETAAYAEWSDYWTTLAGLPQDTEQHNRFYRVNKIGSSDAGATADKKFGVAGTSTAQHLLSEDDRDYDDREFTHDITEAGTMKGDIISAQAFFKPKFTLSSLTNATLLTFTLDGTTDMSWIDFVPNLTNYYIVSDKISATQYLPTKDKISTSGVKFVLEGEPVYVGKITNHYVDTGSASVVHKIIIDTALTTATHGNTFRLMKISETTFQDTPELFDVNKMFDTGLKYDHQTQNFITGDKEIGDAVIGESTTSSVTNKDLIFEEGLFAMYLILDVDTINTFPDRRTLTDAKALFTDAETIDCYITDGTNSTKKALTVSSTTNKLRFTYSGKLTGNGIVSFGEVFTITTVSKPKLRNAENAYIGTTFVVGTDAETAIEDILEENDIDVDKSEKDLIYTGNIVASVNGTTITLQANAVDIVVGNAIYNQDSKFIGKINTVSTTSVTLAELDSGGADIAYTPIANDELTLYNRKPLILSSKFDDSDAFSAINFLASKKGLEYKFVDNPHIRMELKRLDDYDAKRKFTLAYSDAKNLLEVESNTSLFDKANKIVVIGDNVKAEIEIPTKKRTKTLKVIDENIKQVSEAKIKAEQLLAIHNQPAKKIQLKMDRQGFELMKPGDTITLDFPNHNVPRADYTVFEIENVMSSISTITVGTFNKTIAERLAEINQKQQSGLGTIFTKNANNAVKVRYEFDDFTLRENSLKYVLTSPTGMMLGWSTSIGFVSTIGLGTDTATTVEIKI